MAQDKYEQLLSLKHHEVAAKIDLHTGEVKPYSKKDSNIPIGKELFKPKTFFKKVYPNGWAFLRKYLSNTELIVAYTLGEMAKANTNSLEPLRDGLPLEYFIKTFDISINTVSNILYKLLQIGVYGKFEVVNADSKSGKYWVFNPFLSFSGRLIDSNLVELFKDTHCAYAFKDKNYKLTEEQIKSLTDKPKREKIKLPKNKRKIELPKLDK